MQSLNARVQAKIPPEHLSEVWIATSDWKAYYRNLLKPTS